MTSKKQKRMAGEKRQMEQDERHQAEIENRKRVVGRRAQRRMQLEVQRERRISTLSAIRALKGGLPNG